jgi:hypothetical protein
MYRNYTNYSQLSGIRELANKRAQGKPEYCILLWMNYRRISKHWSSVIYLYRKLNTERQKSWWAIERPCPFYSWSVHHNFPGNVISMFMLISRHGNENALCLLWNIQRVLIMDLKLWTMPSLGEVGHDGVLCTFDNTRSAPDRGNWCGPSRQATWTVHYVQNHTLLGHSPPAKGCRFGPAL